MVAGVAAPAPNNGIDEGVHADREAATKRRSDELPSYKPRILADMDLEPAEHVIFEGHPSWRSILGFYIRGLLVVVLAGAAVAVVTRLANDEVNTGLVTLVVVVLVAIVLVAGYVKRLFTTYTISNHRLHIRRGIIARAEQQTQINRVQNVNTHQSVLQRMLMIGDVNFDTAAGDDYDFEFGGVASPAEVVEAVHRAQRESDSAAPMAPSSR